MLFNLIIYYSNELFDIMLFYNWNLTQLYYRLYNIIKFAANLIKNKNLINKKKKKKHKQYFN